ncbi:MAG TPA: hypothetical protein VGB59_00770 [Allosphingosinicella sp.]|jgi:hypothetical protein
MISDLGNPSELEGSEPPPTHQQERSWIGSKGFAIALALSILLVSAASLVFSLQTGSALDALVKENARLVRASSTPLLSFTTGNVSDEGDPQISFEVSNSGTGPARIVWFQIRHNGGVHGTLQALAGSSGAPVTSLNTTSKVLVHTLLRAGEQRKILMWNRPRPDAAEELAAWQAVERDRFNYEVEACYCSLLRECWQSTLDGDEPRRVKECRTEGRPSFGNTRVLRRVSGQRGEP